MRVAPSFGTRGERVVLRSAVVELDGGGRAHGALGQRESVIGGCIRQVVRLLAIFVPVDDRNAVFHFIFVWSATTQNPSYRVPAYCTLHQKFTVHICAPYVHTIRRLPRAVTNDRWPIVGVELGASTVKRLRPSRYQPSRRPGTLCYLSSFLLPR